MSVSRRRLTEGTATREELKPQEEGEKDVVLRRAATSSTLCAVG